RFVASGASTDQVGGDRTHDTLPTCSAIVTPAYLTRFIAAHPEVRIRLRGGGSYEFISAIGEGRMDVAVLGLASATRPTGVATRELATERLVAVLPQRPRLASRSRPYREDRAGETFVDLPAGTPGRAQSDLACRAAGTSR